MFHSRLLVLAVLALPVPSLAAPRNFSLKDAVAYALEHSPGIDTAQRQAAIATLERKNSFASFLPTVDLNSSLTWKRTSPPSVPSNPWGSTTSIDLSENLYDNGASITRHQTSRIQETQSEIEMLQTRDKLFLDIAGEFYRYALAVKVQEIQRDQNALLKLQYANVESGYQQGVRTQKDYLRFKTQLNQADIDLVNARNEVIRAEKSVRQLIGMPLDASQESLQIVVDESKPGPLSAEVVELKDHREYRLAELRGEIQELAEAQVHRRLWPEVFLRAGASYGSSGYVNTGRSFTEQDSLNWNASLNLKYNLLDWGTRRREAAIASERTAIQANATEQKLISLRQELDQLALDLERLRKNYQLGEDLLALQAKNLNLISREYRQGKVQYLDYITSLKDLATAQTNYYSSLFNLKKGLLTLKFHQGRIYEAITRD